MKPEVAIKTSKAGAMIAEWVNAIYKFALIYQEVHPLEEEVKRTEAEFEEKMRQKRITEDHLKQLKAELEHLHKQREEFNDKREKPQAEAQETEVSLERANHLINGLASERTRWEKRSRISIN